MPALTTGKQAPHFSLPLLSQGSFSLAEAQKKGPVLAAFFKVSCPTCQYAFPFIQRLFAGYGDSKVTIVGISQNDVPDTKRFTSEFQITFPIALDDIKKYPVSNSFGLTNVPTLFWISPSGEIELTSIGWSKPEMEQLNQRLAASTGRGLIQLFRPGESVAEFKAG